MNGIHPGLTYDLHKALQRDRLRHAEMARAAAGASRIDGRTGIVRAVRRAFGAAIVAVGRRVEGGAHVAPADAVEAPAAGLLRLAR